MLENTVLLLSSCFGACPSMHSSFLVTNIYITCFQQVAQSAVLLTKEPDGPSSISVRLYTFVKTGHDFFFCGHFSHTLIEEGQLVVS